ncbi:syntaxin-73 protein, putative (macronuclear) [Tetrahymena thermophila SB210]|uniref:Syntaxin-73 protein, putative n=1 Tax=Tetrahymena thermophila (strain SB210) TaxID=312017 RepID=Q22WB1_TETTS|nr:syntaxin-73 protein, putative [Tetrahymena thermophila SB210]EAR89506.1 syntaxin-73 protein, putative [Tetrahymena thermophila SB210]|eukprot:XP_001009751.1 syntaxin-73 protein, putative [Tetrahymena thermophila SB210]
MSSKISYLLEKLYDMDRKLGGKEYIDEKKKNYDEFTGLKDVVIQLFFDIQKKIDQKQLFQTRNTELIKLEFEIKNKMVVCNQNIVKMNDYLKKNRSKDENLFQKRQKIYDNLHQQYITLNNLLFKNDNDISSYDDNNTINDSSAKIGFQSRQKGARRDLTDLEKNQMREIEEQDQLQEKILDQLNDGVLNLKAKAEKIGESIQHTIDQCKQLEAEMTKTETVLINSNDKLKSIVKAYRSPSKCCLDFVLIIILIGLGVAIYYQLK